MDVGEEDAERRPIQVLAVLLVGPEALEGADLVLRRPRAARIDPIRSRSAGEEGVAARQARLPGHLRKFEAERKIQRRAGVMPGRATGISDIRAAGGTELPRKLQLVVEL